MFLGKSTSFFAFRAPAPKEIDWDIVRVKGVYPNLGSQEQDIRAGYVGLGEMTDLAFECPVTHGQYATFSYRSDTRKIPAAALKLAVNEAIKAERNQNGFIPRERKREIKEQISLRMREGVPYTPSLVDLLWDMNNGILMVFAPRKKAIEVFEIFKMTFGFEDISSCNFMESSDCITRFRQFFNDAYEGSGIKANGWSIETEGSVVKMHHDEDIAELVTKNYASVVEKALSDGMKVVCASFEAYNEMQECVEFSLDSFGKIALKYPQYEGEKMEDEAEILLKADICSAMAQIVSKLVGFARLD